MLIELMSEEEQLMIASEGFGVQLTYDGEKDVAELHEHYTFEKMLIHGLLCSNLC